MDLILYFSYFKNPFFILMRVQFPGVTTTRLFTAKIKTFMPKNCVMLQLMSYVVGTTVFQLAFYWFLNFFIKYHFKGFFSSRKLLALDQSGWDKIENQIEDKIEDKSEILTSFYDFSQLSRSAA